MRIVCNNGFILIIVIVKTTNDLNYTFRKQAYAMNTPANPTLYRKKWGLQGYSLFPYFCYKIVGTRSNRPSEAVTEAFRTCTHN